MDIFYNREDDELFKRCAKKIKELFNRTDNYSVKYMVKLLYEDYIKTTKLQRENWKYDVMYQCSSVIDCIDELIDYIEKQNFSDNEVKSLYRQIINDLGHSMNHLEQSSSFGKVNACNSFRNTGSYDKIFKFYYGIIKGVLAILYTNVNEERSELIPIITVDAVIIPISRIYLDLLNKKKRLLTISLPMDVWYNIPYYTPLLIHELVHYLCSIGREQRNKDVLFVMVANILETYYLDFNQEKTIDRTYILEWLQVKWDRWFYQIVSYRL